MDDTRGGSPARWAIIVGLAFAVALVVAVLVLRQPLQETGWASGNLPGDLGSGDSALQAYTPAEETARAWQSDAQPVSASSHWRSRSGRWPGNTSWMFQFYSPGSDQLAIVVVDAGQARLLREAISPYQLDTFAQANWQVDGNVALEGWWASGGATFLSINSGSEPELVVQLRVLEGSQDQLVWTVRGIAGGQSWTVVIDARTGEQVQN